MTQGSEARRKAVTALGEALYTHMRACHVVPAACITLAAVAGTATVPLLPAAMLAGAALHPVALSAGPATENPLMAKDHNPHVSIGVGSGTEEGGGVYPASAWRPVGEVREGVAWLQGELARRGALFNPVHPGADGGEPDVAFFADLLPGCLEARDGRKQVRHYAL